MIENIKNDLLKFATIEDILYKYKIDQKELELLVEKEYQISLFEFVKQCYAKSRTEIRKSLFERAEENNQILMFLAKVYLPEVQKIKDNNQLQIPNLIKEHINDFLDILQNER